MIKQKSKTIFDSNGKTKKQTMSETKVIKTAELEIKILPNGIHIYKLADWSDAGLVQWQSSLESRLEKATNRIFTLYDMRHLTTITPKAFGVVSSLETHPKIEFAYSVALVKHRKVAVLVNALIRMRGRVGGTQSKVFSDMDEAINWLLTKTVDN